MQGYSTITANYCWYIECTTIDLILILLHRHIPNTQTYWPYYYSIITTDTLSRPIKSIPIYRLNVWEVYLCGNDTSYCWNQQWLLVYQRICSLQPGHSLCHTKMPLYNMHTLHWGLSKQQNKWLGISTYLHLITSSNQSLQWPTMENGE